MDNAETLPTKSVFLPPSVWFDEFFYLRRCDLPLLKPLLDIVYEYSRGDGLWFWDQMTERTAGQAVKEWVEIEQLANGMAHYFASEVECEDVYQLVDFVLAGDSGNAKALTRVTLRQFTLFVSRFAPFETSMVSAARALLRVYDTQSYDFSGEVSGGNRSELLLCYHSDLSRNESSQRLTSYRERKHSPTSRYCLVRLSENVSDGLVVTKLSSNIVHEIIRRIPGEGWSSHSNNGYFQGSFDAVFNFVSNGFIPLQSPWARHWQQPCDYIPFNMVSNTSPWCKGAPKFYFEEYPLKFSPGSDYRIRMPNPLHKACWDGSGCVTMHDRTLRPIRNICVGDQVFVPGEGLDGCTSSATVVRTLCSLQEGTGELVEMVDVRGCWLTSKHPVLVDGKWVRPWEVGEVVKREVSGLYNLVLDGGHVLEVNGVAGVTLAHNSHLPVLADPFWGTQRVVESLRRSGVICKPYFRYGRVDVYDN